MKNKYHGLVQIPLLMGLLLVAIALPIVAKLAQKSQDVRNRAAEPAAGEATATPTCNPNQRCSSVKGCVKNNCSNPGMNDTNCIDCGRLEGPNVDNSFCNLCPTIVITNTPTPTPTIVFNCTPDDKDVVVKAFNPDGTEGVFSVENGQLKVDSKFTTDNKVVFQVTISNKSNIKNVGLKFGSKAVAWAKLSGIVWTGSVEGSGLSFYGDPTASGNLTVKFPVQIYFEKDIPVDILVQYY